MYFRSIPVSPLETNCYLLGDEAAGRCCLADPGEDAPRILDLVRESGLTPDAILLTHGHWDHRTAVPAILEAFPGLPVYIHEEEILSPRRANPRYYFPPAGDVRTVGEGDVLQAGGLTFRVLHTPGHSAGSLVYLCGDVMLSGDTLFAGTCGRCDLPGGSLEDMMTSLRRLAELEGDYVVYPGHGGFSSLAEERRFNPYMVQALRRGR